jgi:hypothetical protein
MKGLDEHITTEPEPVDFDPTGDPPERDEGQFLDLQGVLHEISIAPAGPLRDPWPFVMIARDGHAETFVQIHREDAKALVAFFTEHLGSAG